MRIYLAGPMRGIPEFNFSAFQEFARMLRVQGHEVFSPAEEDIRRHGCHIFRGNMTGDEEQLTREHGFSRRQAFAEDTQYICNKADTIAMMPGWENSLGAQAEWALARALGHRIIYLDD